MFYINLETFKSNFDFTQFFFFLPHHLNLDPSLLNAYSSICIAQFLKINDNLFTQLCNAQHFYIHCLK